MNNPFFSFIMDYEICNLYRFNIAMVLTYAVCNTSVAPLRAAPSHRAEQVSQLLFGERVAILEIQADNWCKVLCEWDEYIAWVKEGQLHHLNAKEYKKTLHHINIATNDKVVTSQGSFLLNPGSSLFLLRNNTFLWHQDFAFKGQKTKLNSAVCDREHLLKYVHFFYGAPYHWGGRGLMGIDCSGFVQMVFKLMNIRLPRDAYQQAEIGETIVFLAEAQLGDIAFFDNAEGKIVHVGILLDASTIIHATESSGSVVIDKIDPAGIISKRLRKRTHQLRLIKRIVNF